MTNRAISPEEAAVIVQRMTAFASGDDAALSQTLTDIGREALQREIRMDNSQPPGITPITPNMQPGGLVPPPRMVERLGTFALNAPYPMYIITAQLNFDKRPLRRATTEAERLAALSRVVRAHNIVDEAGEPYPPGDSPDFWLDIPDDVAKVILESIAAHQGTLDPTNAAS